MKVLQKLSMLSLLLLMTACTNAPNMVFKNIEDILGKSNDENNVVKEISPYTVEDTDFKQESIILNSENVSTYLEKIKARLKNSEKRVVDKSLDMYKVLLGEYLVTPISDGNTAKLTNFPKNTNSRLRLENGNLIFRTIYTGNYAVSIYQNNNLLRKINVEALSKYRFSESNIYDIILENLDKNNKTLEDAITLYKINFPNGKYIKSVNYYLLKYGIKTENKSIINEALEVFKNDILSYNDEEKIEIIKAAKLLKKDIYIPSSLYKTENTNLLKEVGDYLKDKAVLDKKDVLLLEKISGTGVLDEDLSVIERVNSWYKRNGDISKVREIEEKKSQTNKETYFDIAMKNLDINPKIAIENFKKSLLKDKLISKKADTYYNIAASYLKLGNKVEAIKYISLLKQEFSGTDWVKKAEKLLKK